MNELDPQKAKDLEQGVNQGVIAPTEDELKVGEDIVGAVVIAPDSNIDPFLSDFDRQAINGFETFGCNIFSGVGGLEIQINALGGDDELTIDGHTEISERELCVAAGLDGNGGSSESQWENAVNNTGFVRNDLYPFTPGMTQSEFFKALTPEMKTLALRVLDRYTITHRRINTDLASIKEALKYGAVKIFIGTGAGWNQGEPNVIKDTSIGMNHAVLVRKISDLGLHIRDQYFPFLKVLEPTYKIYYAFQTLLIPKGQTVKKYLVNDAGKIGVMVLEGFTGTVVFADTPAHLQELKDALGVPADVKTINLP